MILHRRTTTCRFWARSGALPLFLAMVVSASRGQSATVTGKVEMPDNEMKNGLRVHAIPRSRDSKAKSKELTKRDYDFISHVYSFRFERLQPGVYDFVICDGLDYKVESHSKTLQAGQVVPVDFLLKDRCTEQDRTPDSECKGKISAVLHGPEGGPTDGYVFLKDIATGCNVAEVYSKRGEKPEFTRVNPEKYKISTDEEDGWR